MFRRGVKNNSQQPRESSGVRQMFSKDAAAPRSRPSLATRSPSKALPRTAPAASASHVPVNAPELKAVNEFASAMQTLGV